MKYKKYKTQSIKRAQYELLKQGQKVNWKNIRFILEGYRPTYLNKHTIDIRVIKRRTLNSGKQKMPLTKLMRTVGGGLGWRRWRRQ